MRRFILSILCMSILPAASSLGGARHFTYVYEATTSAPGSVESENWITWQTHRPNDRDFNQVDFRHELEFGITQRFQAAVYIADWSYESEAKFRYQASALELIYNFTNPVIDPVGLSIYQEIKAGDHTFESESKVIAQKNLGRWIIAYNATLEAKWESGDQEGELGQAAGVSYEVNPHWSVGGEILHEVAFPEWADAGQSVVWLGPNVSVRVGNWWATMSALSQATQVDDEPDFQLRTIFGYAF